MTVTGVIGVTYTLDQKPIGSGGEGDIYSVIGMDYVAKIYKTDVLSGEVEEKLRIMVEHPPNTSVLSQVAWPLDLAYDGGGKCLGFIMPKLSINADLGEIYKYPPKLPISAQQKVQIAQNICVVISEVHSAGYVFGDFNPLNIGLDKDTGLVSFLDTDTYHVVDPAGSKTYRCNVCAPGYAAPELLEKCSDYVALNPGASKNAYAQTPLPTFTQETDNFALAIHIFKLLMNGYTPYGGIIETVSVSQSSPGVGDTAVRRDSYCFKPGYKHQSAAILPLEAFPQEIADLFTRAFIIGKHDPKKRPSATEWYEALVRYSQIMMTCGNNPLHQYSKENSDCPLCEADERYAAAVGGTPPPPLKQTAYASPSATTQNQASKIPIPSPAQSAAPSQQLAPRKLGRLKAVLIAALSLAALSFLVYGISSEFRPRSQAEQFNDFFNDNLNRDNSIDTSLPGSPFVAVQNISGVPTEVTAGTTLNLTGTVNPTNATNSTIRWNRVNLGGTDAVISGNTLISTSAGTVTIRATITDGAVAGDFTQDFDITIRPNVEPAQAADSFAMPNLIGTSIVRARSEISRMGLREGTITRTHHDSIPHNQITGQSIQAGTDVESGTIVNLVVSDGPPPTPTPPTPTPTPGGIVW